MQHIIVHGKNNPYSDLYLIILMMCPCVPVVIYIPCVPVVICVPVSQFVISLWVSRSSFIFPVSRCPGRHLCPGVPVCNFYSNNPCVPVVIYISRLCPRRPLILQLNIFPWTNVLNTVNDVTVKAKMTTTNFMTSADTETWRHLIHRQTDRQLIFIYIDKTIVVFFRLKKADA